MLSVFYTSLDDERTLNGSIDALRILITKKTTISDGTNEEMDKCFVVVLLVFLLFFFCKTKN